MHDSDALRRGNAKLYLAVIASTAKQSMPPREERMDCFASLAMTKRRFGRGACRTLRRARRRRMKHQRKTVHAVAQAGRLRPIVEHVTEMATATAAVNFGPQHPKSAVLGFAEGVFERLIKGRPSGAALQLGLRRGQRQRPGGGGGQALPVVREER